MIRPSLLPLVRTAVLLAIVVVLPLVFRPELLWTWPPLLAALAGCFLNLSQPAVSTGDLKKTDNLDRRSVLLIYIAGILVYLVPILDYAFGRQARPPLSAFWSLAGIAAIFGGSLFRYWSIRTLGRFFTSTVRVQEGQTVVQAGPYRFLRHPSYLGAFAAALGISLVFRSYAGLLVCALIYFPVYTYRIAVEEAALSRELGPSYEDYKKRTWRMIPPVY